MSTQSLIPQQSPPLAPSDSEAEQKRIDELRVLLLGSDRAQAARLRPHLERIDPQELGRLLPAAIRTRNVSVEQDEPLADALMPTIAATLKVAVKRDPQAVADAIFPVMAPAIRQAIANTFSQLVQQLDRTLQAGLSLQGLKWRVEAWRTGKSYAEVVLYHTLVYRVDYVFLIHRETSLLLQHVSRDGAEGKNAEIVSGMMAAIKSAWQDFTHDAFGNRPDAIMSEARVGDFDVWFEQGPDLILACVLRGEAPAEYRVQFMAPAIEAIHRDYADEISRFDGDPDPFVTARHRLEECLQARTTMPDKSEGFRVSPYLLVPLAIIVMALAVWAFFAVRREWRWRDYLAQLEAQPGIVVTETGTRDGKYFVAGLRDPMAIDPDRIRSEQTKLSSDEVASRWQPYQALEPRFILERLRAVLAPPASARLELRDGVLIASGSAPQNWIEDARRLARAVPGVMGFREEGLIDEEILRIKALMESEVPRFIVGTARFVPGQTDRSNRLIADARRLFELAARNGVTARMEVVGHTDDTGTVEFNDRLSQERAETVKALLAGAGLDASRMTAIGVGSRQPVGTEPNAGTTAGAEINRSVTFRVTVDAGAQQKKD